MELNSIPFYAFHKTIHDAAECLNRELLSATASAKIVSYLWPKYKEIYYLTLEYVNKQQGKKIQDVDFPYCVVGTDCYHTNECKSLYSYLYRHRDYDSMNHLVNVYDELQSRRKLLEVQVGPASALDNKNRMEYLEARLKRAVRLFLNENDYDHLDSDLYDYSADIASMRDALHHARKRDISV